MVLGFGVVGVMGWISRVISGYIGKCSLGLRGNHRTSVPHP